MTDPLLSRRRLLTAGAAALVLVACGDDGDSTSGTTVGGDTTSDTATSGSSGTSATTDLTAADFEGLNTCALTAEATAGPFPLDEQFDRRDVREGYPGQPMRLGFRVLDGGSAPIAGAAVEIWHTDASGDYSAFADGGGGKDEGAGTTFMRGSRAANADGIAEFLTIVPGWYSGRAVHIHLRVHIDDATVLTSQVYFDESYLESVYANAPYAEFGNPDTSNRQDGIAGDPEGDGTLLHTTDAMTSDGSGTLALVNLGIAR